jgi:hypothetical protein
MDYILVLKDILTETLQYISRAVEKSASGRRSREEISLVRTLGRHAFRIRSIAEDVVGERMIYTYAVWMFDRLVRRAYTMPDRWLETLDHNGEMQRLWKECAGLWSTEGWRIERRDNKLVATRSERGQIRGNL